ncbi:unnamed protein product [Adineta ricciae]|nr:unnamed protein product [Adineta ricciae]
MTSVSVMMTVLVLNLHYRGPKKNEIPFWLQQLLGLSLVNICRTVTKSKRFKLPCPEKQSVERKKSINDIDKSPRSHSRMTPNGLKITCTRETKPIPRITTAATDINSIQIDLLTSQEHETKQKPKRLSRFQQAENSIRRRSASRSTSAGPIQDEIQETLHSLLRTQKEFERDQRITSDWRVIATKVDKILFYIFLLLTVVSTLTLLVVAPFIRSRTQLKTKLWRGTRRPQSD